MNEGLRLLFAGGFLSILLLPVSLDAETMSSPGTTGDFRGSSIRVRWQVDTKTRFQPDLVVLVENAWSRKLSVDLDWDPRVCGERSQTPPQNVAGFLYKLLETQRVHPAARAYLQPGGWTSWVLPFGWPGNPASDADCITSVVVRSKEAGKELDRLELRVPVSDAVIAGDAFRRREHAPGP